MFSLIIILVAVYSNLPQFEETVYTRTFDGEKLMCYRKSRRRAQPEQSAIKILEKHFYTILQATNDKELESFNIVLNELSFKYFNNCPHKDAQDFIGKYVTEEFEIDPRVHGIRFHSMIKNINKLDLRTWFSVFDSIKDDVMICVRKIVHLIEMFHNSMESRDKNLFNDKEEIDFYVTILKNSRNFFQSIYEILDKPVTNSDIQADLKKYLTKKIGYDFSQPTYKIFDAEKLMCYKKCLWSIPPEIKIIKLMTIYGNNILQISQDIQWNTFMIALRKLSTDYESYCENEDVKDIIKNGISDRLQISIKDDLLTFHRLIININDLDLITWLSVFDEIQFNLSMFIDKFVQLIYIFETNIETGQNNLLTKNDHLKFYRKVLVQTRTFLQGLFDIINKEMTSIQIQDRIKEYLQKTIQYDFSKSPINISSLEGIYTGDKNPEIE